MKQFYLSDCAFTAQGVLGEASLCFHITGPVTLDLQACIDLAKSLNGNTINYESVGSFCNVKVCKVNPMDLEITPYAGQRIYSSLPDCG